MYSKHFSTKVTAQSDPIPGKDMVPNSAGGYAFEIDPMSRLERFLILGCEGGTYYASEKKLTVENSQSIVDLIKEDGVRVLRLVESVSSEGRAPSNDPAIFVLALCFTYGYRGTRALARDIFSRVVRTSTHLFHFAQYIHDMRGWGRVIRGAVRDWYNRDIEDIAYQVVKYRQRDGWTHRDVLRLAHVKPVDDRHQELFSWVTKGEGEGLPDIVGGYELARNAETKKEILSLIDSFSLTREMIPSEYLNDPEVQEHLLLTMPLTAMLRNLANFSKSGLLVHGRWDIVDFLESKLTDMEYLKRSRIHPIHILTALHTYASGGSRGGTWIPVSAVMDILDTAFYKSFGIVEPTNQRILIGIDVSASMGMGWHGTGGLTARQIAGAMSLIHLKTEPHCTAVAFSDELIPVECGKNTRLDDWNRYLKQIPMGRTDCALPILYAQKNIPVDVFQVWTDNETWYGKVHPVQALREYRNEWNTQAKLVVAGVTSTGFSIADPNDPGMLDVVGFDSAVPQIINQFSLQRGN